TSKSIPVPSAVQLASLKVAATSPNDDPMDSAAAQNTRARNKLSSAFITESTGMGFFEGARVGRDYLSIRVIGSDLMPNSAEFAAPLCGLWTASSVWTLLVFRIKLGHALLLAPFQRESGSMGQRRSLRRNAAARRDSG